MLSFLFWNLNRKPLAGLVRLLVDDHTPDILLLAECHIPLGELLVTINASSRYIYHIPRNPLQQLNPVGFPRILLLSRLPASAVRPLTGGNAEAAIFKVRPLGEADLLLVGLHLPSKLHLSASDQLQLATRIRPLIEAAERRAKHQRTLVIGDLNMDPFEQGVTSSEAFHAVMDRQLALRKSRQVKGEQRSFFYNPMWSRLGDGTSGPPGTYYKQASGPSANYWYTFDQVLIRPDLLSSFEDENLRVLTRAGAVPLVTGKGLPDSVTASDHLPIFFKL